MPAVLSLAVFPGWLQPLLVVGLIATLELTIYIAIEPWFYGRSAGVSEVALLIGLAFWTILWGPLGLLLGTPMTVCFVVFGKYIPVLAPLAMLLSDEPALSPPLVFYQRLIARDGHEAERVAGAYLQATSLEATFDDLLLTALARMNQDVTAGILTEEDRRAVLEAIDAIARVLVIAATGREPPAPPTEFVAANGVAPACPILIGVPAQDEADEFALRLLALLLDPQRYAMVSCPAGCSPRRS